MKNPKFLLILLTVLAFGCVTCQNKKEPQVEGIEITYKTDATVMTGYLSRDVNAEGKRPGILVVHEWWGHNEYSRQRADMLAELGYVALAVDMYGEGKNTQHAPDAAQFSGMVMKNLDEAKARFTAALETLKEQDDVDADRIGAMGYCFGGSVALSMANAGFDLDAVAAFHSGLGLPIPPSNKLAAKVLVCNGAADPFIPQKQVEAFKAQMDSVNADYKYISYEGVKHAFTSKQADQLAAKNADMVGDALAYDANADSASWASATAFLAEALRNNEN